MMASSGRKQLKFKSGGKIKRYVEGGTLEMLTGEKQNGPEYSAEDVKEGLRKGVGKLRSLFGFGDDEKSTAESKSEPATAGSKPAVAAESRPAAAATNNRSMGSGASSGSKASSTSESAGPSVEAQIAKREDEGKSGDANVGPDFGNGEGASSFTSTSSKPAKTSPNPARARSVSTGNTRDREAGMTRGIRGTSSAGNTRDMEAGTSRGSRSYSASPSDIPGTDTKGPFTGERVDNSNLAARQAGQMLMGLPAVRGLGSATRGALSLARAAGKSAPEVEGAGTGKIPEAKPDTVSNKPAIDRLKEADLKGPPRPKSTAEKPELRETPAMERARKRISTESPAVAGARQAAETTKREQRAAANKSQAEDAMAAANKRAQQNRANQSQASDAMAAANKRAQQNRANQSQASDAMAAASKRAKQTRARQRSESIPDKDREPGFLQEYISGRAKQRNRAKDLSNDGLPARYENKKGGKIPAFQKGGMVTRADGCAQRGKTRGRMV